MIISFLASHGGSSARAIIQAMASGELDAEPGILITNNADSDIQIWCKAVQFPVFHISSKTHPDPKAEDLAIMTLLKEANTDVVVCSGYMKIIGFETLTAFENRILNIHPALLPLYGGVGMYGDHVHAAVLEAGDAESGATVHIVTEDYDEGPVMGQSQVDVLPDDTVETLRQRVQETEPELYIESLKRFLSEIE